MDHVSPEVRSAIMASVRSRENKSTERVVGRWLWENGLKGYRKHWPVKGRPDFAWPSIKVAVFVDGCFWHGCPCKALPKSNAEFWRQKIESNRRRDQSVSRHLRRQGWVVVRLTECAVRDGRGFERIRRAVLIRRSSCGLPPRLQARSASAGG
ncbi:MAG: very short patch repair endonuclease [Acidobacteria bacterium]|nr:very short patch repair endonuclease [Acidobacteriota bacterium]